VAAVGFYLLAGKLTDLSLHSQIIYIIIAGAGVGLMLGPASTDALNRAPPDSYSEVTGITQTARNFGASLGLAVLGAILTARNKVNIPNALTSHGVSVAQAHHIAATLGSAHTSSGANASGPGGVGHAIALANARSNQTVFYVMAGVMALTFVVAVRSFPRGRASDQAQTREADTQGALADSTAASSG
jgi:hypothetical protein